MSGKLALVEPSLDFESTFVDMVKDFRGRDEIVRYFVDADLVSEFSKTVHLLRQHAVGKELPEGFVPYLTYWLVRDDKDIVGNVRLRLKLIPFLEEAGGHVGYDIRPSERRKGYGSRILALALEKAQGQGLTRVLLTAAVDNMASRKIIEKNGGRFENEVFAKSLGKPMARYWIDLRPS